MLDRDADDDDDELVVLTGVITDDDDDDDNNDDDNQRMSAVFLTDTQFDVSECLQKKRSYQCSRNSMLPLAPFLSDHIHYRRGRSDLRSRSRQQGRCPVSV